MIERDLIKNLKDNNVSNEKKLKMIDDFFATDRNGNYINLKFTDWEGNEHNFIGINRLGLTIDEIVAVKKYAGYLYEEFIGKNIDKEFK